METFDLMKKYATLMAGLQYGIGENPRIFLKQGTECYATREGVDFACLKESDLEEISECSSMEKDILLSSKVWKAVIVSRTPYVGICIDSKRRIPAVLDDMAQIIGARVRVIPREERLVAGCLKRASAVMIQPDVAREGASADGYAITVGRNLYEAYVALTVLEKSAEVLLKASVLGGAKPIGRFERFWMREKYMRRYSKAEKERKDSIEG